jgi:hypothetical protein
VCVWVIVVDVFKLILFPVLSVLSSGGPSDNITKPLHPQKTKQDTVVHFSFFFFTRLLLIEVLWA